MNPFVYVPDTRCSAFGSCSFDIVTCCGVLEHIVDERAPYLHEMWRVLKIGGLLFIPSTPNRIYPYDHHTTQLMFVPWMSARMAKRYTLLRNRTTPETDLELAGRRGETYWGILKKLPEGSKYRVLSAESQYNLLTYLRTYRRMETGMRRVAMFLMTMVDCLFCRPLKIPIGALLPTLTDISLQKLA